MEVAYLSFERIRDITYADEVIHTPEFFRRMPSPYFTCTPFHLLIYHEYDQREIIRGDAVYTLGHDSTFLFFSNCSHELTAPVQPYHAWAIGFLADEDDMLDPRPLAKAPDVYPLLPLPIACAAGGYPAIRELFAEIVRLYVLGTPQALVKARCHLAVLLSEVYLLGQRQVAYHDPRIDGVIAHLDAHLAETISVDGLAARFGISRRTLQAGFKRQTGQSLVTYQHARRVRQAATQLRNDPDLPLKHIAQELGFYDEFYFSKVFKRHMGMSPHAFRRAGV